MSEMRKGRMDNTELAFIDAHRETMTAEDMAKVLNRREIMVERHIEKTYGKGFQRRAKDAEYNIQSSIVWEDLQRQFSKQELDLFLYYWGRVISQFKDDVFPTEQMQVVDTIKYEVLMNRALTQQQECRVEIQMLRRELNDARMAQDLARVADLERQVAVLLSAQESLNSTYLDMSKKKDAILKEMKATRDARIKSIESSKASFTGWQRRLSTDMEMRESLGKYIEKMRLAADVEVKRLSEYYEYADGVVDQPFLTPETVI